MSTVVPTANSCNHLQHGNNSNHNVGPTLIVGNGLNGAPVPLQKTSRPQSQIGGPLGWGSLSQASHNNKSGFGPSVSAYGGFKNVNGNPQTMTGMLLSGSQHNGSRNHNHHPGTAMSAHNTVGVEKMLYS